MQVCPDVAALIGVDCSSFCGKTAILPSFYGSYMDLEDPPNAFDTHALKRSFKHTRMPVYRASVQRGVGKQLSAR